MKVLSSEETMVEVEISLESIIGIILRSLCFFLKEVKDV